MHSYFSVIIPFAKKATQWHPTEKIGPFSTLSRGAFSTPEEAHAWARAHLGPKPKYSVKEFLCG